MRRQVSLVLTLVAWLFATGSQWELLQTIAWGRMIASYSHTMPLALAVEETFAGDTLCSMCKMVQGAQRQDANETAAVGAKAPEKIYLVSTIVVRAFASTTRTCLGLIRTEVPLAGTDRAAPPLPPPRLAA